MGQASGIRRAGMQIDRAGAFLSKVLYFGSNDIYSCLNTVSAERTLKRAYRKAYYVKIICYLKKRHTVLNNTVLL